VSSRKELFRIIFFHSSSDANYFSSPADPAAAVAGTKYPAMSEEEVEEWLAHIPVFAVTDSNGAGVVLKPDGEQSVFYFFMSPMMANATLNTLKANNEDMDLKISAFSLGKIWYKILNADKDTEVTVSTESYEIYFFGKKSNENTSFVVKGAWK
jgi:hypothetical protein